MTAAEHRMKRYLRRLDALGSRTDDETLGLFGIPMGMISQAAGSMGGGSGGNTNTQAAVKQALEEQHNKEMMEQAAKNAATVKLLAYSLVGILGLGAIGTWVALRK